ncbi:hypothetical protein ZHAS_00018298 [Anopheles sinensis]|uniref:Uncharacterized protein n=1 Tax=Anopheles sinensis TaxID=74873 RepID=A0A084WJ33_ANOSI|nr:hypothetical protein ZHAS_00018298 [Anopheles sinensis]
MDVSLLDENKTPKTPETESVVTTVGKDAAVTSVEKEATEPMEVTNSVDQNETKFEQKEVPEGLQEDTQAETTSEGEKVASTLNDTNDSCLPEEMMDGIVSDEPKAKEPVERNESNQKEVAKEIEKSVASQDEGGQSEKFETKINEIDEQIAQDIGEERECDAEDTNASEQGAKSTESESISNVTTQEEPLASSSVREAMANDDLEPIDSPEEETEMKGTDLSEVSNDSIVES